MAKKTRPTARSVAPTRRPPGPGLRALVGSSTYSVWLDMLRRLVPHERTHRLSVIVAGFLQHAAGLAAEKWKARDLPEGSPGALLLEAQEGGDPEAMIATICSLAEQMFRDAGVRFRRVNRRGDAYSIAEDAASEFMRWEDMPWE